MFKRAGIIMAGLALCLAGCAPLSVETPPETPARIAPPLVKHPARPGPPPLVSPYTNVNRPVIQFNPPPAIVLKPAPAPVITWTSLNRWAATNGVGAPHRLAATPVVRYAIGSPHGVMIMDIGSRDATWNGTVLHLGFAPEIIDDQLFVHSLDLEKNLAPLLGDAPVIAETHHIIVIDPGHGGENGGTVSVVDGRPEKMFTLDWALRLAPLLEAKGWRVYLTRTNDADIAVTNRAAFSVTHGADLFISLHFNSGAADHKQAGLETYCLTPTGMPSTITRGYPDLAWQNFPANAFDTESLVLALRLHNSILRATGEEDRGVRRARFLGVLRGQRCPAVLIEGGYLSNPQEAEHIENAEYRQKLAEAVARAVP